ncbi:hypothetical protein RAS1_19930 [Phycisphaerae bacterium RAS1]|nr:hypothetical protein RAS1_19930 [Phycisphaerae bacterium RAS1]
MTTQFKNSLCLLRILALGCAISHSRACWAGGSACVPGASARVCVAWDQGPDPVPNQDFTVSFADASNPAIELRTGANWIISSEQLVNGQPTDEPANIGSLTIDPSSSAEIFSVTIARDGGPGAANVGTITLDAASWAGHSSIAQGSHITGDLTGPLTLKSDANGDGGELTLTIDGDLTSAGVIDVPEIRALTIGSDVHGDVSTNLLTGSFVILGELISSDANIHVGDFADGLAGAELLCLGSYSGEFAGHLVVGGLGLDQAGACDVPGQSVLIIPKLTGDIDLNGQDLGGYLRFWGSGDVSNIGLVLD